MAKIVDFNAAAPALGYLYQCRYALLLLAQRVKQDPAATMSIERFDDIAFESGATASELIQTKHHLKSTGDLSDPSVDLWKTIRVWAEGIKTGVAAPTLIRSIVTTASAPPSSAASLLRPDNRDPEAALQILGEMTRKSKNRANESAYSAFAALPGLSRSQLVASITVFDQQPSIINLDKRLQSELRWAVRRQHVAALVRRIEGWWFNRVIDQLAGIAADSIRGVDLESVIADFQRQFSDDDLPIDYSGAPAPEEWEEQFSESAFIHQLRLICLGSESIRYALTDYYRAYQQRALWLREDLLLVGELAKYERRLVEEWNRRFLFEREELEEGCAETARVSAGKRVYRWAQETASITIRAECREYYVQRGSYHMLADELRVGWHPDFLARLKALLPVGVNERSPGRNARWTKRLCSTQRFAHC